MSTGLVGRRAAIARLEDAESESEVVAVVRDCLAQLTPDEVKCLPEDCMPWRIRDHQDVAEYALRLGRRRLLSQDSLLNPALVDDLYSVLMEANARVGLLAIGRPKKPANDATMDRVDDER